VFLELLEVALLQFNILVKLAIGKSAGAGELAGWGDMAWPERVKTTTRSVGLSD